MCDFKLWCSTLKWFFLTNSNTVFWLSYNIPAININGKLSLVFFLYLPVSNYRLDGCNMSDLFLPWWITIPWNYYFCTITTLLVFSKLSCTTSSSLIEISSFVKTLCNVQKKKTSVCLRNCSVLVNLQVSKVVWNIKCSINKMLIFNIELVLISLIPCIMYTGKDLFSLQIYFKTAFDLVQK